MPMVIIADEPVRTCLTPVLASHTRGAVIQLERSSVGISISGLDHAVELAEAGEPVLMLGFNQAAVASDRRFQLAMSYGWVEFRQLPLSIREMDEILGKLCRVPVRPHNHLVRMALSLPAMQPDVIGAIRHDLRHAQNYSAGTAERTVWDRRWLPKARALYGELDRAALAAAVEGSPHQLDYAPLEGKFFDSLCCDVEGTLLLPDGSVNGYVASQLKHWSHVYPITLWTGGEVREIEPKIRQLGFIYPLLPKAIARGARVGFAIDDEDEETLYATYGVECAKFLKV